MCFTAAWWANISRIVYGMEAEDIREQDWKIDVKCEYLNSKSGNKIQITGRVLRDECLRLFD
jgi:tRNA(Arg) A34 adenosine deaminase TadA